MTNWAPEELSPITLTLPLYQVKGAATAVYLQVLNHAPGSKEQKDWMLLYEVLRSYWPEPPEFAENE
jgi:hypothetical protein